MSEDLSKILQRIAILETKVKDLRDSKIKVDSSDHVRLVIPQKWMLIGIGLLVLLLMGTDLDSIIRLKREMM